MQILRMVQGVLKPFFPSYIHTCFQSGSRHCRQKLSFFGQKSNIGHRVFVVVIQQGNFTVYRLPFLGKICIFYHSIVKGIGQLHNRPQIGIHRLVDLADCRLIFLPDNSQKLFCQPPVQRHSNQENHHQGADRKIHKNGVANAGFLKKFRF